MRRYLLAALAIAAFSILATTALYELGFLSRAGQKLATYYANLGLIPRGSLPHRPSHYLAISLLSFASTWAVLDIPQSSQKAIVVIGSMLLVVSLSVTLLPLGLLFEPFSSLFAILLAASLSFLFGLTHAGSRKALLHRYLGGRISHQTFTRLLDLPSPGFLQGQNCLLTVLSLRLFNLPALRSALPPQDLLEISSLFLRHSAEFLAQRGAYLDESSPDSVRAYFGLAHPATPHAELACQVARELDERLTNLNLNLESRFFHHLHYGIALSSGEVTLGPYRSRFLCKLSPIGSLAEYAHRLCGANAAYGSRILLSADTYSLIRDSHAVRPMELIYDASTELMAEAYELIQRKELLSPSEASARDHFWQGVILYREGRAEEALKIFSALQAAQPLDQPLAYFIIRTQSLLTGNVESPGPNALPVHGHTRVLQSV